MAKIIEKDNQFVANTYARFPLEIVDGKGSIAKDSDGKEYIDLGTGIGVTAFGYCDEKWVSAVKGQLDKIQHTSNLYYTKPCSDLAEMLCEKTGMKKVFFSNSGAEANECAIKTARKYAQDKKGEDYYKIITLNNSFHGRTITTLSATGQDHFHKLFKPLTDGFLHANANDIESVKTLVDNNKICAIMIECVQGEGGVIALNDSFVKAVWEICQNNDILLIVDEVQTGNGRTGELYAYMNYGITPDIVTTAKGLGGGLPIGACLFNDKTQNVLGFGDHGSTFGGNPVACAGAISIIERIDDELLKEVKQKSKFIFDSLNGADGIISVSGMGLMIGVETVKPVKEVLAYCMQNGLLPLTAKTKLRLLPALNIPMELLEKAVEIIKQACKN